MKRKKKKKKTKKTMKQFQTSFYKQKNEEKSQTLKIQKNYGKIY